MSAARTPTPWHVNGWDVVAQPSIKWHVVATTARLEYDDKDRERDANAAYIVECVNSHAELLATTAKLREALTELLDARGTSLNIVGHDPVSGHPLSREGMAALKARELLALPTPSVTP